MTDLIGRRHLYVARTAIHRRGKSKRGREWTLLEVFAETGDRRPITHARFFTFLDVPIGWQEFDIEPRQRRGEYLLVEPEGPPAEQALPELRAQVESLRAQVAELERRLARLEGTA